MFSSLELQKGESVPPCSCLFSKTDYTDSKHCCSSELFSFFKHRFSFTFRSRCCAQHKMCTIVISADVVTWSVCVFVCLSCWPHQRALRQPIEIPFGGKWADSCGLKEPCAGCECTFATLANKYGAASRYQ